MFGKALGRSAVIISTCALVLVLGAPSAPAATPAQAQTGAWVTNFPCTLVDYDLSSNEFVCVGSNDWAGSLNGVTYFTMVGTLNPITLDAKGTIDERFIGAAGASYGTLHLIEQFSSKGGNIHVVTRSIEGTGMLKNFEENLTFIGVWTLASGGGGSYNA